MPRLVAKKILDIALDAGRLDDEIEPVAAAVAPRFLDRASRVTVATA
jgi:hypothetical protein